MNNSFAGIEALRREESQWDISVKVKEDTFVRVGKRGPEYFMTDEFDDCSVSQPASLPHTPIDQEEALHIRRQYDELFSFRHELAGYLREGLSRQVIGPRTDQSVGLAMRRPHEDEEKSHDDAFDTHYLLCLTIAGEFFLTKDHNLSRQPQQLDEANQSSYTYIIRPERQLIGRVLHSGGHKPVLRRIEDGRNIIIGHVRGTLKAMGFNPTPPSWS